MTPLLSPRRIAFLFYRWNAKLFFLFFLLLWRAVVCHKYHHQGDQMARSVVISEELHKRLKIAAAQKGLKLKDVVSEALRLYLGGVGFQVK
jgi:hypothetical protein